MPGCHRILGGLAAGIVEDGKHNNNNNNDYDDGEHEGGNDGVGGKIGYIKEGGEGEELVAARYELGEEW